MPPPSEAISAMAAHDMALSADNLAGKEIFHIRTHLDNFTHEFVSDHHRHRNRLLCPRIPLVYMEIGAANTGAIHTNQDIVDANSRLGDILEPETALGFILNKGFHV